MGNAPITRAVRMARPRNGRRAFSARSGWAGWESARIRKGLDSKGFCEGIERSGVGVKVSLELSHRPKVRDFRNEEPREAIGDLGRADGSQARRKSGQTRPPTLSSVLALPGVIGLALPIAEAGRGGFLLLGSVVAGWSGWFPVGGWLLG